MKIRFYWRKYSVLISVSLRYWEINCMLWTSPSGSCYHVDCISPKRHRATGAQTSKETLHESQVILISRSQMLPSKVRSISSRQLLLRNVKWKHLFWRGCLAEGAPLNCQRATAAHSSSFSLCPSSFLKNVGGTTALCSSSLFTAGPVCTGKDKVTTINSLFRWVVTSSEVWNDWH